MKYESSQNEQKKSIIQKNITNIESTLKRHRCDIV